MSKKKKNLPPPRDPPPVSSEAVRAERTIEMPAPTAWPIALALGITLLAAGVATNLALSAAGLILSLVAVGGWIGQLSPKVGTLEEPLVPPTRQPRPVQPAPAAVESLRMGMPGHRMRMPEKVHPYSAGVKGGALGGVAMAATALAYGALSGRGIWYPINLLAGMLLPSIASSTPDQLEQFSLAALILATFIHVVSSLAVGLFFGVLLPTLPRGPVLWGGVISPLLWTGGIHALMGVLNPVMNGLVNWPWFLVSQFAYGITAGIVVVRSEKVFVSQERRRFDAPHDPQAAPPKDSA